jgi:hypothetical protein
VGGGALLGDTQPHDLYIYGGVDCLDRCVIEFYIECFAFYQDMFSSCWKHYGVYACTPSRAIISDGDGTGRSTRVYATRCAWAAAAVSYLLG